MEERAFTGEDGYTMETTVPRVKGLHPAIKLKFRPALLEERIALSEEMSRLLSPARVKALAEHIGRHVVSWDAKLGHGREVDPKDYDTVRRLQPELFEKILNVINGYTAVQEAEDAKNSSAGLGSKG